MTADTARTICLLAMREQLSRWGEHVPVTAIQQMSDIHSSFFAHDEGSDGAESPTHAAAAVLQGIADGHAARNAAAAIEAAGGEDALAAIETANDGDAPTTNAQAIDEAAPTRTNGADHGAEAPPGGTPVGVLISSVSLNPAQADLAFVNDYLAIRAGGVLGMSADAHAATIASVD